MTDKCMYVCMNEYIIYYLNFWYFCYLINKGSIVFYFNFDFFKFFWVYS